MCLAHEGNAEMRRQCLAAFCASCIFSASVLAASQVSRFKFLQDPGPFSVGLKVVNQYDRSRTFPENDSTLSSAGKKGVHCRP